MNDKDNNIIIDTVNNLISKYSDNSHVYSKLNNYITNQLPELLENAEKSLIEREKRKKQLERPWKDLWVGG